MNFGLSVQDVIGLIPVVDYEQSLFFLSLSNKTRTRT